MFAGNPQDASVVEGATAGYAYDTLNRKYSAAQSRWISPDPAGLGAVDLSNPQSWNRYAYVGNNPLSNTDPLGLQQHIALGDENGPPSCAPLDGGQCVPLALQGTSETTGICPDGVRDCQYWNGWGGTGILTGNCVAGDCGYYVVVDNTDAANKGRVPNNITCGTVLPNGRTVGSYVQAVSNQINGSTSTTSTPYGPATQYNGGPSPLSVPSFVYSSINFKIMFQGQANAAFLGDAGNFAYGAISANIGVPLWATEAVAGGYALWAGHQDANGPFWMDQSASQHVQPGYNAQCK
jgi:RHS repeat-associated protein